MLEVRAEERNGVIQPKKYLAHPRMGPNPSPCGRRGEKKVSLALSKTAEIFFVFLDPASHLLARKFSRFRHLGALRAKPRHQEQHQLLFLFQSQRVRCSFNFLKLAHARSLAFNLINDNCFLI